MGILIPDIGGNLHSWYPNMSLGTLIANSQVCHLEHCWYPRLGTLMIFKSWREETLPADVRVFSRGNLVADLRVSSVMNLRADIQVLLVRTLITNIQVFRLALWMMISNSDLKFGIFKSWLRKYCQQAFTSSCWELWILIPKSSRWEL